MTDSNGEPSDILGERLVFGTGFTESDRPEILERLAVLGKRLNAHPHDSVALRLSVKNRNLPEQKVTLECRLAGAEPLVTTSILPELPTALNEVRDDMVHRLDKLKTRRDPRHVHPHRP